MRRIINGKTYDTKKSRLIYSVHETSAKHKIQKINNELSSLSGERLTAAVNALTREGNIYISYKLYINHTNLYYAVITIAVLRQTKAVSASVSASAAKVQYSTENIFVPIRNSKAEKIISEIKKAGVIE